MKLFSEVSLIVVFSFLAILMPKTLSGQLSWQPTNSEVDYPIYEFVSQQDNLYAAFYGAGVFKTSDEGETWTACHNGLTNFLARDLVTSGDNLFLGTNKGGVFKSLDEGQSWQSVNDDVLHKNIWSLLAAENRLFAGTGRGLFFSDDEGGSWQQADLPRPKAHHQIIFSLAVKGRSILAGSNSHVYLSEDFGETWQQIKVPTRLDIMTIQVQNSRWLLGTSGEGILSSENGKDWKIWNENAGNTRSMILTDNSLILGLSGQGVIDASDTDNFNNLNEGFTNPSIRSVGYHNGKFHIQLFDAFGKNIAQITPLSEQYKGVHQTSHNMNELGGGTYYFHLQLGDRLVTKPIVLIKH